jgi:hypothetical protein
LYDDGEITRGTAARLAGLNRFEMREILREEEVELRVGITAPLQPALLATSDALTEAGKL